jgi:hypothetical protein
MSVKKIIAKEFVWFFGALVMAVPLSILFTYLMNLEPATDTPTMQELVLQLDLMIIGGIVGMLFVYLIRLITWAIKMVVS